MHRSITRVFDIAVCVLDEKTRFHATREIDDEIVRHSARGAISTKINSPSTNHARVQPLSASSEFARRPPEKRQM
jgi:hypothetical protein